MNRIININIDKNSQIAIFGLGKFGMSLLKELTLNGVDVFCCDIDNKKVQEAARYVEHVMQADATNDDFLEKIGISNFDIVVISFSSNFEDAVIVTLKLKELNISCIIAKATDNRHKRILETIGATYVIQPEIVMGERLAHAIINNDPMIQIKESDYFDIEQIFPKEKWIGRRLSDLSLPKKESINVLGIIRQDELLEKISSDTVIMNNDILVIIRSKS